MRNQEPADAPRKVNLFQGDYYVSRDPNVVVTTILGSCVAACVRDAETGVGGINHFLLPGNMDDPRSPRNESVGVHLMELLINGLLREGARKHSLQAKLFGGGRTVENLSDIGAMNAKFATRFLEAEGIPVTGGSLGGNLGRRIQFWPATGRVRQSMISPSQISDRPTTIASVIRPNAGEVDLF